VPPQAAKKNAAKKNSLTFDDRGEERHGERALMRLQRVTARLHGIGRSATSSRLSAPSAEPEAFFAQGA